jgi:glycerate 2-kinase
MPVVPERPVLVAPDAFKGTLRSAEVAGAIGRGLERAGLMPPDLCALADGGAGTIEALLLALGGEAVGLEVQDARGRQRRAAFALLEDGGTAVVELATAPDLDYERERGSTYAAGELICAAIAAGAQVVLVAAGGPATTDGGAGALAAIEEHGGLGGARVVVLTDARTAVERTCAVHGAVVEQGVPFILDALRFDGRMRAARAVVTGEGRLDERTLEGRLVGEIGTRTRQAGVPLHAIVGSDALDAFGKRIIDLQVVQEATTREQIEAAAERLGAALRDGSA